MTRALSIIFGIVVLALVATGLTEAAMALGQKQATSPEPTIKQTVVAPPKAAPTVAPVVAPVVATPAPAAPVLPTATVNGFVHMRASATTASSIITNLNTGDVVTYTTVDTGLWQAVSFHGIDGYVYKTYLNY